MKSTRLVTLSVYLITIVFIGFQIMLFLKQQELNESRKAQLTLDLKLKTNSTIIHLIDDEGKDVGRFDIYDEITINFKKVEKVK